MFAETTGIIAVVLTAYYALYVLLEMPNPTPEVKTVKLDRHYFEEE
jgi:hypothetical protein